MMPQTASSKDVFIICCNAAALPVRYIDYLSTAAPHNALHLKFTSLQNRNAVIGAEMEVQLLQLIVMQL